MRLPLLDPSDVKSIDMEQFKKMVDLFMEKGFTYFDTAWMYRGSQSEIAVKTALAERLVNGDSDGIGKVQAPHPAQHGDPDTLIRHGF